MKQPSIWVSLELAWKEESFEQPKYKLAPFLPEKNLSNIHESIRQLNWSGDARNASKMPKVREYEIPEKNIFFEICPLLPD